MNQTVAVTGAAGFIGKAILLIALLARGFHVRTWRVLPRSRRINLTWVRGYKYIRPANWLPD